MQTTFDPAPPRAAGRLYLWLGLAVGLLGPILYAVQLLAHRLTVAWYTPILGTLGAVVVLFALTRRRSVWRYFAITFLVLLAAGEWFFLLSMSMRSEERRVR